MGNKSDDQFIRKMIMETFDEMGESQSEGSKNVIAFGEHKKDHPLKDFAHCLHHFSFLKDLELFRLKASGMVLDFPTNWSIFSMIKKDLTLKRNSLYEISEQRDFDDLFGLFKELGYDHFALVVYDQRLHLLTLKEEDLGKLQKLRLYLLEEDTFSSENLAQAG